MKVYSKTNQVVESLTKMVADLRGGDDCFLPSERKLCEMLDTSRVTLRKALAVLEERNMLLTGTKSRLVTGKKPSRNKGTIVFVSFGYSRIILPAWNRLWDRINREAEARGYRTRLELYNENDVHFKQRTTDNDHYIIYSDCPDHIRDEFFALLGNNPKAIGVYEGFQGRMKNIVALDSYAVGRVAAEYLLAAGYRAPGFIGWNNGYLSFKRRAEGFIDTLNAAGVPPRMVEWLDGRSAGEFIKNFLFAADRLITPELDSLFVYSDEGISLFYDTIAHMRKIPEKFGLITVSGSHQGLSHYPPITSVSHGTAKVAAAIFDLIEEINRGKVKNGKTILVEPSIHEGFTVRTDHYTPTGENK